MRTRNVFADPTLKCCCADPTSCPPTIDRPQAELNTAASMCALRSADGVTTTRSAQLEPSTCSGMTAAVPGYQVRLTTTTPAATLELARFGRTCSETWSSP